MTNQSRLRELQKFIQNVDKISDGQVKIVEFDQSNLMSFDLEVNPNGGLYEGGTYNFKITLGADFPQGAPTVWCTTWIYHPNIDPCDGSESETNVCLSMFQDGWMAGYGMEDVVQGILFVLHQPDLDDPWSVLFEHPIEWEEYVLNVKKSLSGEPAGAVQTPDKLDTPWKWAVVLMRLSFVCFVVCFVIYKLVSDPYWFVEVAQNVCRKVCDIFFKNKYLGMF